MKMKTPKQTMHLITEDSVVCANKIEFLEFNFDGKGSAIVRYDSDQFLSVMEAKDVTHVFFYHEEFLPSMFVPEIQESAETHEGGSAIQN